MWQPLFKEPSDDLEREDEWGEPKGFLVGGWGFYPLRVLAQQYFDAASILVRAVERNQWEDYKLAFPVLYLYRHFLELMLKAVLEDPPRTHDIERLTSEVEAEVQAHFGQPIPAVVKTWLYEFATRDRASTAYRYGEVFEPESKSWVSLPGEEHVELQNLRAVMQVIHGGLSRVLDERGASGSR
jgi:hypothetical protein